MEENLADDLMVGAKPIAKFMGLTERQIFYMAEIRQLPIFKIGNKLAARKSKLRQHLTELESGQAA